MEVVEHAGRAVDAAVVAGAEGVAVVDKNVQNMLHIFSTFRFTARINCTCLKIRF